MSVGDCIGVEDEKGDRDESGECASEFTSPKEEKESQKQGDECDRKTRPE